MQESFWWWQCSDRYIISLFPHLNTPFLPSLISLVVSVDVQHHVYLSIWPHLVLIQNVPCFLRQALFPRRWVWRSWHTLCICCFQARVWRSWHTLCICCFQARWRVSYRLKQRKASEVTVQLPELLWHTLRVRMRSHVYVGNQLHTQIFSRLWMYFGKFFLGKIREGGGGAQSITWIFFAILSRLSW